MPTVAVMIILLAGCGFIGRPIGTVIDFVPGNVAEADASLVAGDAVDDLADKLERVETDRPVEAETIADVRGVDRRSSFIFTVAFDRCTDFDPVLSHAGSRLSYEIGDRNRNCVVADPHTALFAIDWADLPAEFEFGEDGGDDWTRVIDREVQG